MLPYTMDAGTPLTPQVDLQIFPEGDFDPTGIYAIQAAVEFPCTAAEIDGGGAAVLTMAGLAAASYDLWIPAFLPGLKAKGGWVAGPHLEEVA